MDRKKYIVEASDDVKKVIAMGVTHGGAIWTDTTDIENLEELNSDYINEHYGDPQAAYNKGLHDGESKCRYCNEYQRGLDDAWEAARKIVCDEGIDMNTLCTIFRRGCSDSIIRDYSAAEAIAKLKAYEEQKAADEIKIGDEVRDDDGDTYIITCLNDDGTFDALYPDGTAFGRADMSIIYELTGRHFEIDKILEAMKEWAEGGNNGKEKA